MPKPKHHSYHRSGLSHDTSAWHKISSQEPGRTRPFYQSRHASADRLAGLMPLLLLLRPRWRAASKQGKVGGTALFQRAHQVCSLYRPLPMLMTGMAMPLPLDSVCVVVVV